MIDTGLLKYENIVKEGKIDNEKIIQKNSNITEGRICIKPNKETSTLKEFLEIKKQVDEQMGENGKIQRLDIAFDTMEKLEEKKELYRLFLYCFGLSTGKKVKLYNTRELFRECNLKIKLTNYDVTAYNCEDKEREGNTRLEYRSLRIRSGGEDKDIIKNEVEKYVNQLKEVIKNKDELIKQVEKEMIKELEKEYKRVKFKYVNFSAFVDHIDRLGLILTKEILSELMKRNGYKSRVNDYVRKYRGYRNGGLNFSSGQEIEKLCKMLINENYKILKNEA